MGYGLTSHSNSLGELPPPAPRACFGRGELIEMIVGLAENLEPIALIGAGGIGKTSVALAVLHHNRIKERFGENRRFIRCDQFPASPTHFLARLSEVIGAGVKNPEDLTPLRPFLSSKEMLIILDNAEPILDPKGTSAEEIYSLVDELSHERICLCITSRITTVPPHCKRPEIPTLSMEAARDIFYRIYGDRTRSNIIDDLLQHLDFHALSITLLATTASHNVWDHDRLTKEWDARRAQVLQTDHNKSLAATIELSLDSPTFRSLGPDARDLLGVVAFFPQGINERNIDWLFPIISDRKSIFDKFCLLSLTYRSNGFVAMLAPIRDYLGPRDPQSSQILCATRDFYFSRLSVDVDPNEPGFEAARWIKLEYANVEYLLDRFTSIDQNADDIWGVCSQFMRHLYWHKPRQTVLRSKIEALPDDHRYKSRCLSELARLFARLGNYAEQKRLLTHMLELGRQHGDDSRVAGTLKDLSEVNRLLNLYEEGIRQGEEALEIYERIGETGGQTECLNNLTWLLFDDRQLDAAENTASRAIDLLSKTGEKHLVSKIRRALGYVHRYKGEREKAIHHLETALEIAFPFSWHDLLFWIHFDLAVLFSDEDEFDEVHAHIELAKSHAVDDPYLLGRAMHLQADVWYQQRRLEDAKLGATRALEIYEKSGAEYDARSCMEFLQEIERAMEIGLLVPRVPVSFLEIIPHLTSVKFRFIA